MGIFCNLINMIDYKIDLCRCFKEERIKEASFLCFTDRTSRRCFNYKVFNEMLEESNFNSFVDFYLFHDKNDFQICKDSSISLHLLIELLNDDEDKVFEGTLRSIDLLMRNKRIYSLFSANYDLFFPNISEMRENRKKIILECFSSNINLFEKW